MRKAKVLIVAQSAVILVLSAEVVFLAFQNRRLTSHARSRVSHYRSAESIKPGTVAPPIEGCDLNGDTVRIGPNKAVSSALLVFFAPHCPACEVDAPTWKRLSATPAGAKVAWVGICLGGRSECLEFVRRHGIAFPVVADSTRIIAEMYNCATVIPQVVHVKNGIVDYVTAGAGSGRGHAELARRLLP
ncbi:MAG: redoxin domain-containing protein [bacterium]|jgi:peroxiredoxin|nr:redoxin domain-containing protein [candidate division KSB1 bacterium]MDH7560980.1 redoxin domain-containing protein [bacterium]